MNARGSQGSSRRPLARLGRRVAVLATVTLALYALVGASSVTLATVDKVTICHATSSESSPYVTNEPDASGDLSGHLDHTGPVWYPGAKADKVVWGDIIPPIPGIIADGLNWTDEGQAIHENGCQRLAPSNPDIDVEKTADPTSLDFPGGSVTYTYDVTTDEGNVPLSGVTIDDDTCDEISGPSGDTNGNDQLDMDETWTYTCTMELMATTTNLVEVTGTYDEETVDDTATATVTVGEEQAATGTLPGTGATPTSGEAAAASPSLPSTSTEEGPGQGGGPLVLLLILLGVGAASLVVLGPTAIRVRH